MILGGNITLSKGSFTDLSLVKISVKVRGGVSVGTLSINTENDYKSVNEIKSVKINNENNNLNNYLNNNLNNNFNNNYYHEIDQYGNLILFGTFLNVKNNLKNLEFSSAKRFCLEAIVDFHLEFIEKENEKEKGDEYENLFALLNSRFFKLFFTFKNVPNKIKFPY